MKSNRCYICYEIIEPNIHFHPQCSKKLFQSEQAPLLDFNDQEIEHLALELINQKIGIPGVQKKLSLFLERSKKENSQPSRLTIIGYLAGDYILKPPTKEFPYMPELEDLTMHLADIAKIKVALHSLVPMKNGALAYITKRFDRKGKQKIAVEDLCQLSLKLTEQKYRSSSENIGKIIYQHASTPGEEILNLFQLILFCFLVGNADMHLKNFSLLTEDSNNITLSPCYDLLSTRLLIPEHIDPEELALPVNGKKRNIRRKDFIAFGENLKIPPKVIERTIESMIENIGQWEAKIQKSFISETLKAQYLELIWKRKSKLS